GPTPHKRLTCETIANSWLSIDQRWSCRVRLNLLTQMRNINAQVLPMFFGFRAPNFAQNAPVRQNAAGNAWTNRQFARRSRREYCHNVAEPKSGRWHRTHGVESRLCAGRGVARGNSGEQRHPLSAGDQALGVNEE